MTKKGLDKRFNSHGIEGHWTNDSVAGEMTIDLLNLRDSALTGTIGELIAWKYIRMRTGVMSWWFSGFPHLVRFPFRKGEIDYNLYRRHRIPFPSDEVDYNGLRKRQIEYLKTLPRSYDLIAVKRKRLPTGALTNEVEEVYLVEVKTTQDRTRHGKFKGRLPEDIQEAKSLGFKPLLIIVELLDNWTCQVTCEEI
jgi:hypothetical protein